VLLVAVLLFGGPTVAVPNVVGLSYEQAKTRINDRGLQVGTSSLATAIGQSAQCVARIPRPAER
jgi:beta-lactam-binding protein with PASTA domain